MSYINLLEILYPIGSIYMSFTSISPAQFVGGTWEQLTGRYLRFDNNINIGGSNTHYHWLPVGTNYNPGHLVSSDGASQTHSRIKNNVNYCLFNYDSYAANGNVQQSASYEENSLPAYQNIFAWRRIS